MPEEGRAVAKEEQSAVSAASGADDEPELYKADDFRMYCMKVLPCSKRFCHDWTVCPYSHPGEKAKRRDPRLYSYTGIACPNMKKDQSCTRGDACPYAHNVFEYWLHPTRYRTQLCNDGEKCARKICFFAHTLEELRVPANKPFVPPEALAAATTTATLEAARKAGAAADSPNKAGLQMLSTLLNAQPGNGENDLLKTLQAKVAGAQTAQEQQVLVDALATLLQSCGFVQEPASHAAGRKSFDGVKAHAMPTMPRDDRLDLGASGKSRSDPARTRSLRTGGLRGRGRHSIDLGHDLKRAMAAQTIHEDASLPTLKSIVEALASNKDFLQQQQAPEQPLPQQQNNFSYDELAAFSAGMAAAAAENAGNAQQAQFSHEDMQLQQLAAAAAAGGYSGDWAGGVDPVLLQNLQAAVAAQQPQHGGGGFTQDHLPLNWNRRQRGSASLPAGPGAYSMQAAAQARARAALAGDVWLGDAAVTAQGGPVAGPGNPHNYRGGWPDGSACAPGAPPGTGLYSAFSEPMMRSSAEFLAAGRGESWAEVPGGLSQLWQTEPEGIDMGVSSNLGMHSSRFDTSRLSTDSRRSSDSCYMGGLTGPGHEYMPHCAPIEEYGAAMRGSMDSMRYSMDSMRSAGSPNGTPRGPPQSMGPYTDYRGSSLFAFSGPFSAGAAAAPGPGNGVAKQEAGDMHSARSGGAAGLAGDGDNYSARA